ncbi:MAG: hypothetical protein AAFY28_08995 [Actinomycetota bacterium]
MPRDESDQDGDVAADDEPDISPWASGDVPVAAAPDHWEWPSQPAGDEAQPENGHPTSGPATPTEDNRSDIPIVLHTPAEVAPDGTSTANGRDGESRTGQRRLIVLGVVAALLLGVAVVGIIVNSDDAPEPAASGQETDEPTDVTLPEPDAPTSAPTSPAASSDSEDQVDAQLGAPGAAGADINPPNWFDAPDEIDLPPEVAAIGAPTEVVVLTSSGLVHTLSLPSGRVRTVPTPMEDPENQMMSFGSQLVVAPDATAVRVGSDAVTIIPRDGLPSVLELDTGGGDISQGFEIIGWSPGPDGSRFLLVTFATEGEIGYYLMDQAGTIEPLPPGPAPMSPWTDVTLPTGERIVNEAGGAYRVRLDGNAERIADGTIHASNGEVALVRECDANLQCDMSVLTLASGERRPIDERVLPTQPDGTPSFPMTMSPDGTAIGATTYGAGPPERVIVDLFTGARVSAPVFESGGPTAWSADGVGAFEGETSGPGLRFLDRGSGEVVSFGGELDQIVQVGTRWPEAELDPPPAIETFAVDIDREVPIEFVALISPSGAAYVDLLAGTGYLLDAPRLRGTGTGFLLTGEEQVVSAAFRGSGGAVIDPSGFYEYGGVDDVRQLRLPAGGGAYWWSRTGDDIGVDLRVVDPVDGSGDEVAVIQHPTGAVLGSDGQDNVVVEIGGDVYLSRPDSVERLTSGALLAIGSGYAFVEECDGGGDCAVARIDRATGTRANLAATSPLAVAIPRTPGRPTTGTSASPDGAVALVELQAGQDDDAGSQWAFVDVDTNVATYLPTRREDQPVIWSEDSAFAVVHAGTDLLIYDRAASSLADLKLPASVRAITPAPTTFADLLTSFAG